MTGNGSRSVSWSAGAFTAEVTPLAVTCWSTVWELNHWVSFRSEPSRHVTHGLLDVSLSVPTYL
jgi:hypothetical protein